MASWRFGPEPATDSRDKPLSRIHPRPPFPHVPGFPVTIPIYSHTFENGLILVGEPRTELRSAAFTFLVPCGTVYEPAGRAGLSGFVCEMVQRGAGQRDSRQLVRDLDNLGVQSHDSVSAAHVAFVGATLGENLGAALAIYTDVLRQPHFPAEELEPTRQAMLQDLRAMEDEPAQRALQELRRRHYPEPWGRSPQGEQADLEAVTLDDVRAHYQRHFRPGGAILGVAGQFDWESLKDTVAELLGEWPAGEASEVVEQPAPGRYRHLVYDSSQTHLGLAYASVPYSDDDYYRAWGAIGILGGGMSSRLFTEVREHRGLCYHVDASLHTLKDRGAVFCYAGTSAERAQETLDVTLEELRRLRQGVEQHELDRLKSRIKAALIMQQESSSARSSSVARNWYHLGRVRTLEEVSARIDELSVKSINAYLADNPPGEMAVVTLGPRELEVPLGVL